MPETSEDSREEPVAPASGEGEGEPGREDVAGERGGHPGYDLDESELYEQRDADAPDD